MGQRELSPQNMELDGSSKRNKLSEKRWQRQEGRGPWGVSITKCWSEEKAPAQETTKGR